MGDRKSFLAGIGIVGLAFSAASSARAQDASPSPTASALKGAKPPSAAATAIAATMLRFDAKLSEDELATIAHAIDDNAKAGAALNPKKHRLKNSDEPLTVFRLPS